jgi:plastocyanin
VEIRVFALFAGAMVMAAAAPVALAAGSAEPTIVIKDHKFEPAELHVPAGQRITVTVENRDATPEEIESKTLRVEKVIPGSGKGIVRFGPLHAGTYTFFGDFHQDTAQGKVIAE